MRDKFRDILWMLVIYMINLAATNTAQKQLSRHTDRTNLQIYKIRSPNHAVQWKTDSLSDCLTVSLLKQIF